MSYNSTHTAIIAAAVIVVAAMHYGVDLITVAPLLAAIGGYAGIREYKRMKENGPQKETIQDD